MDNNFTDEEKIFLEDFSYIKKAHQPQIPKKVSIFLRPLLWGSVFSSLLLLFDIFIIVFLSHINTTLEKLKIANSEGLVSQLNMDQQLSALQAFDDNKILIISLSIIATILVFALGVFLDIIVHAYRKKKFQENLSQAS